MGRRNNYFKVRNPQGVKPESEQKMSEAEKLLREGINRQKQSHKRLPFDMYKRPDGIWVMQGASNEYT
jgi:hypothetical protein